MLPVRLIERRFLQLDNERMDILLELRSLIAGAVPDAVEELHSSWISYHPKPMRGASNAGLCIIHVDPDGLRLAFLFGALLPDPKRLLEGTSRYKRFVRVQRYDTAPWDDLRDLLVEAARFNPGSRFDSLGLQE